VLNQTDEQIDALIEGVKVTYFNAKWDFLRPKRIEKLNVASLESIAAMQVNALFLRAKFRDYYDLYFLARQMTLREMFAHSQAIVDGLTFKLFAAALLYIDDIEDDAIGHLEPVEKLDAKRIRDFFQTKLERMT